MTLNEAKQYTKWVVFNFCILYGLIVSISYFPIVRNNSDAGEYGWPSGVIPRTDSLTGCQYLETSGGGITPRLDREGRHICDT